MSVPRVGRHSRLCPEARRLEDHTLVYTRVVFMTAARVYELRAAKRKLLQQIWHHRYRATGNQSRAGPANQDLGRSVAGCHNVSLCWVQGANQSKTLPIAKLHYLKNREKCTAIDGFFVKCPTSTVLHAWHSVERAMSTLPPA